MYVYFVYNLSVLIVIHLIMDDSDVISGYGRFHYQLLALCGWALSSDAIEILSISFVLPPAMCQLQLSDSSKGWLNSAVFLGMMFGGYIWGTLADMWGRRYVLILSLSLNSLGGLMSSFAQTYWLFLLLRIVSGIGYVNINWLLYEGIYVNKIVNTTC